jgi:excisionase family DNA binding protein
MEHNQPQNKTSALERVTWTRREAARILGMSETAVFYATQRGEIPSLRIGKRVLIPRAGLQRLIDKQQ